MEKSLINVKLFSDKIGRPLGSSAIGDIYELRTPLLSKYQFPNKGKYRVSFQQYMRVDSLYNLREMGLRIEKSTNDEE
jgi:gliding motility-associated lipoprotein GldH